MNILDKMTINKYFKKKEYHKILDMIYWNKEVIYELTKKQVDELIEFLLMKKGRVFYLNKLIHVASDTQRERIIDYIATLSYFDEKYIHETYYDEYLQKALEHNNAILIYLLAQIAASKPQKYETQINKIKDYYKNSLVDYRFIDIVSTRAFYCDEFNQKILKSDPMMIIYLLEKFTYKKRLEFISKYLYEINMDTFKLLVNEFHNNKEFYDGILKIVRKIDNKALQGEYLYSLYEITFDDNIIEAVISLNDITIIKKLMKLVNEEKQCEFGKKALDNKNSEIIFNLACSTDCVMTYKLIDFILTEDNFLKNVYLVSNLERRFLSYTLDKIIKEKGSKYYLGLVNKLYLYGLSNVLETINFIFIYKLEYLFKDTVLNDLLNFKNAKEKSNSLTLKKKL